MFPILITQFYGNLSIFGVQTNHFSYMSGVEILSLISVKL